MVSSNNRVESASPLSDLKHTPPRSGRVANSFAQQLSTVAEGYLKQPKGGSPVTAKGSEVPRQNSGGGQLVAAVTRARPTPAPTTPAVPTMLGMGPVAGAAPVPRVTGPTPVSSVPVSEGDAYWSKQPAAVQALRNMPDGEAKNRLALNLANQGYSIDTQIMVWGWDPQMTMTVRQNQGYSWVPSYGQSNVPVGPGISDPYEPVSYNPAAPPPGSIQVSTTFAVGTIQNPLVRADPTTT
jgi:hypothetical protein